MQSMATKADTVKDQVHALIEQLPDDASWDDVAYKIHVRRSIERGLRDAEAGRLTEIEDVRREFGLK